MFDNPQEISAFVNNSLQYLRSRRAEIPQGMTNPDQILQHLLLTSQISQDQYNQAYKKLLSVQNDAQQMNQIMQVIQQNLRR